MVLKLFQIQKLDLGMEQQSADIQALYTYKVESLLFAYAKIRFVFSNAALTIFVFINKLTGTFFVCFELLCFKCLADFKFH